MFLGFVLEEVRAGALEKPRNLTFFENDERHSKGLSKMPGASGRTAFLKVSCRAVLKE